MALYVLEDGKLIKKQSKTVDNGPFCDATDTGRC